MLTSTINEETKTLWHFAPASAISHGGRFIISCPKKLKCFQRIFYVDDAWTVSHRAFATHAFKNLNLGGKNQCVESKLRWGSGAKMDVMSKQIRNIFGNRNYHMVTAFGGTGNKFQAIKKLDKGVKSILENKSTKTNLPNLMNMSDESVKHLQAMIDIEVEYQKQVREKEIADRRPDEFKIGVTGVTKVGKANLYAGELFVRKADADCGAVAKQMELTEEDNELFMMGFEGSPSGEKSIFGKVHDVSGIGHSETSPSIVGNGKWPFIISTRIKPNNVGGNALVIKANLKGMNQSSNELNEIKNKVKLPVEAADLVFRCDLQINTALDFLVQKLNIYKRDMALSSKRRQTVIRKSNTTEREVSRQVSDMQDNDYLIKEHTQQLENRIFKAGELQAKVKSVQDLISYLNRASELHQFLLYTILRTELKEDSIEKPQIRALIRGIGEMSRQFSESNFEQDFEQQMFYSFACQHLNSSLESSFEYFKNLETSEDGNRDLDEHERLVSIFSDIISLEQSRVENSQSSQINNNGFEDLNSGINFFPEQEVEDEWQIVKHDPTMYEYTQEISKMGSQNDLLNASMEDKMRWNHFDSNTNDSKESSSNALLKRMQTIEFSPTNESQMNYEESPSKFNNAKISLYGYTKSIGGKFLI